MERCIDDKVLNDNKNDVQQLLCENCGNKISYLNDKCPFCGVKVEGELSNNFNLSEIEEAFKKKELKKKKKATTKFIFVATIIITGVCAIMCFIFAPQMNNSNYNSAVIKTETNTSAVVTPEKEKIENKYMNYDYTLPNNIEKPKEYCSYLPRIVSASGGLSMRTGSGSENEKVDTITNYSLVYIIGHSDRSDWSLVYYRYHNKYGWVNNNYLEAVEIAEVSELENNCVRVDGKNYELDSMDIGNKKVSPKEGLVLRSGPDSDYRWILRMECGDKLKALSRYSANSKWANP